MEKFTLHPEITLSIDEIAEGVSNSDMDHIMNLVTSIDNHVADWGFTIALFIKVAEMIESEELLNDTAYLYRKGDSRIEKAIDRLQSAIDKARGNFKNQEA